MIRQFQYVVRKKFYYVNGNHKTLKKQKEYILSLKLKNYKEHQSFKSLALQVIL